MCRLFGLLLCVSANLSALQAAETGYDYRKILSEVSRNSDASPEDKRLWRSYLDKASGVTIEETRGMFRDAAVEFNVPQILLEAIGYLENNWIQIGPSLDRGWGIMHLVENNYCNTLGEAAALIGVDPQVLKDDPRQNIRGAAALLAVYAGQVTSTPESMDGWFQAASKFSGLISQELRDQQARSYFSIVEKGVNERTVFNSVLEIRSGRINSARIKPPAGVSRYGRSGEYPEAKSNLTPNNHNWGRDAKVDTWVNHWMGVGTYAGAISWFHNPSAKASAHFCIRHDDGEITQVVSVEDTAWHAGGKGVSYNNDRSIGVEHEATVTHPEWWNSEPMLNASARLTRFFGDKYGIRLEHQDGVHTGGIVGHSQMPGTNTDCAGNIPWPVLMEKILNQ